MLRPALNFTDSTTAGETAKSNEAPDTVIPHTRKTGSTEQTHPRNNALPKSKKAPRTAPIENNPRTNPHRR